MSEYFIQSSHGELIADTDGKVTSCIIDNVDADGGAHLASIIRFDIAEWLRCWNNPETLHIDILDLGYWYVDAATTTKLFASPDKQWRSEIAQELFGRRTAARACPAAE